MSAPRLPAGVAWNDLAESLERQDEVFTASREKRRRPRGYADWRPQRKTHALLNAVGDVIQEYRDYLPLTVRQIFYRLVGAYDYPKTEQAYERLAEKLVRARRAGLLAFDVIRDDGVVTFSTEYFADTDAFWDATGRRIRDYRRDRQAGQAVYVELWAEAAGMLEQLARVADRYSVPVYSAGGFSSLTANRRIADRALERNTPTVLLHVGDHDPSGASIFASMAEDAAAFVQADRVILPQRIDAERIALTEDQITDLDLPTTPPKSSDSRTRRWRGDTCQVEALAPDQLASIVEGAIQRRLDLVRVAHVVSAEEIDQVELFKGLPRGSE